MQSFPVELLYEIFQLACPSTLPLLRLVCKSFSLIVTPLLFCHARISYKYGDGELEKYLEILHAFTTGTHPSCIHARSLYIQFLGPQTPNPYREEEDVQYYDAVYLKPYNLRASYIQKWLQLALANCKKVNTLTWEVTRATSEAWSRDSVLSGISRMPCLTNLTLYVDLLYSDLFSVQSLPSLERLKIHTSNATSPGPVQQFVVGGVPTLLAKSQNKLRHLDLHPYLSEGGESLLSSLVQDSMALQLTHLTIGGSVHLYRSFAPHLRFLQSLSLKQLYKSHTSETMVESIWTILKEEQIYLQHISHIKPSESLMYYLRCYTGLKSLEFIEDAKAMNKTKIGLDDYLDALAGNHANSLERLTILPANEGQWCFGPQNIPALSRLVNLQDLSVSIIAESSNKNYDLAANHFSPSHPVCLLLQTASLLPHLELLSINGANQHKGPKSTPTDQDIHLAVQIDRQVRSCGPLDPSRYRFTVENKDKHYKVERSPDGGYRFCVLL